MLIISSDNLDAALVWGGNGKIYFYKGTKFWRFDPLKRPPVKSTYPKPLSNWEGVPNSIDAALQYTNGYTYFFKGNKYYRFNDRTFSVRFRSLFMPIGLKSLEDTMSLIFNFIFRSMMPIHHSLVQQLIGGLDVRMYPQHSIH